jgi:16S rRNA (cytosine967-C5)-methyltransferase
VFKDAWTLAIETLNWIEMRKLSERLALVKTEEQFGITNADAVKFAHQIVYETVRRKNLIDRFVNSILDPKTISELSISVQSFLRLYVYQTRFTKHLGQVDVKEASRIAKMARSILGWKTLREVEPFLGFLLTREIEAVGKVSSDELQVGLRTFHPTWFVKYCFKLFGRREALAFLEAGANPPPLYIRLNTLRASEDEILEELTEEGFTLEKVAFLKHAYCVRSTRHPSLGTPGYFKGLFYIQDKASCFAAEVANPKAGMTVLDVCAAPGAKTTYLAQLMQNQGKILSVDYSRRRLRAWQVEVARMGVKVANAVIADASVSLPLSEEADVVVLDPPCTSTGVFGKLPSAKWRLRPNSIEKMAGIQWRMINRCCEKVKPGGVLIYATCSITEEENEMIIEHFLKWHPEFSLADLKLKIGFPGLRELTLCQRLYPHIHHSNGFFIAKLLKE